MPFDGTSASQDQMLAFAKQADDIATQLNGMLRTLTGQLRPVAAASAGQFANAFSSVTDTVEVETTKLHTALTGIAGDINTASVNYGAADDQQGTTINKIEQLTTGITSALKIG